MKFFIVLIISLSILNAYSKDSSLDFTQEEENYLKTKKELRICIDPQWMPFEAFKGKQHIGLSSDYYKVFQEKLNIPIKIVHTNSWNETLKYAKNRKCDIVSLITKTPSREDYLNFTTPLIQTPIVLATKLSERFVIDFKSLKDETLAIPKGYAIAEILYKKYPYLNIIEVENIEDGLKKVKEGKIYGLIGSLATIGYKIQKQFIGEVKIGGKFSENLSVPIGVRNDHPHLVTIFQKLLDNISEEQHYNILNKWIAVTIEKKQDYTIVWQLLIFFLFILGVIFIIVQKQYRLKDKKLLEQSKLAQDKLNASLELFSDNVISSHTDTKGIMTFASKAFCQVSGYSQEEMIGSPHNLVRHSDMPKEIFENLWKTIESGETWSGEVKNRKKDGGYCWVKSSIVPMYDNNTLTGYTYIGHDITAQKAKEEFMANMSHELRTPLNAIIGFGNILNKILEKPKNIELIQQVNASSQSLLVLINDILDLAKIEDSKFIIDSYEFYAYDEIFKHTKQFEGLTVEQNLTFKNEINQNLHGIFVGDWLRISQIVLNLISNAIKFTPKDGLISYSADYKDNSLVLTISDNGIGMSKEVQDKIFKPFEQADGSTTRQYGGTGLGLTITQSLVELMNGTIELESEVDVGTSFIVTLPIQKLYEVKLEEIEVTQNDETQRVALNSHILVAEDNKTNQMLIEMLLEEFGVSCDIADDGLEAIKIYNPDIHTLILMDENMPNMNGIEAMKKIKEKYKENCGAIIALTANAMDGDKERFLKLGMDSYVPKPIDENLLYSTLHKFI